MSNEQKVWVGEIGYEYVNSFFGGLSFPNIYDYPAHECLGNEIVNKRELEAYKNSQELVELRKKNNELDAISLKLLRTISRFKKLEVFPDKLWKNDINEPCPEPSDYLFRAGGGVMLTQTYANFLQQFNLGETTLIPLQIYRLDTGELCTDDTFYLLNLCEQRRFVPKQSCNEKIEFNHNYLEIGTHSWIVNPDDDILEVQQSAQECDVDLWHDPWFRNSYFFSARLRTALVEAGLAEKWDMHACKMV